VAGRLLHDRQPVRPEHVRLGRRGCRGLRARGDAGRRSRRPDGVLRPVRREPGSGRDAPGGPRQPPAAAGRRPGIFAEVDDDAFNVWPGLGDTLSLWQFHVDWSDPTLSTFGIGGLPNQQLPVAPFEAELCGFSRSCIPQPDTDQGLDAISDRLMYRLQYATLATTRRWSRPHGRCRWHRPCRRALVRAAWRRRDQHLRHPRPGHLRPRRRQPLDGQRGARRVGQPARRLLGVERDDLSLDPSGRPPRGRPAGHPPAARGRAPGRHRITDLLRRSLGRLQHDGRRPPRRVHVLVHQRVPRRDERRRLAYPDRRAQVPVLHDRSARRVEGTVTKVADGTPAGRRPRRGRAGLDVHRRRRPLRDHRAGRHLRPGGERLRLSACVRPGRAGRRRRDGRPGLRPRGAPRGGRQRAPSATAPATAGRSTPASTWAAAIPAGRSTPIADRAYEISVFAETPYPFRSRRSSRATSRRTASSRR